MKVVENNFNIKFRNFFSTYLYMLKKSKKLLCLSCRKNERQKKQHFCKMCQNSPSVRIVKDDLIENERIKDLNELEMKTKELKIKCMVYF
jgi:hypothetical protein